MRTAHPVCRSLVALLTFSFIPGPALAANQLNGAELSPFLALPFAGLLLSIALFPVLAAHLWHHHYGKIAALWSCLALFPLVINHGVETGSALLLHSLLIDYVPFMMMLFALFTVSGGIVIGGHLHASPSMNVRLLACGAALASFIGTTGAAMVLVRPLLRANARRKHQAHVMVFFIFIVANIGGALSPLGDPPLFLGFLKGVSFFWPLIHLWPVTLFAIALLLLVFYLIDRALFDAQDLNADVIQSTRLEIRGYANIGLVIAIIASILLAAVWRPGTLFEILGTRLEGQNLFRDSALLAIALLSLAITPKADREANEFSFEPIKEVARLFAGIFICIIPVLALLSAGMNGPLAPLIKLVIAADGSPDPRAIFWLSGGLSSVLDNAPTYLVFFELAGGDAARLMGPLASSLFAMSVGSVFMGANSYIGNAPNFMVYSIAREAGVSMPSFFSYMLWSAGILLPLYILIHFLFL